MDHFIRARVHQLYWDAHINCARTSLICLGELFHIHIAEQTLHAAIGLHGAGGFRAQCGLVEGPLMFIGIFFSLNGKSDFEIAAFCCDFAVKFQNEFGSLLCRDLRPNGFSEDDLPHACETLTADAIVLAYRYIVSIS